MTIGTKSVLFGAHQFLIHPIFCAIAWYKLYGFPADHRLWFAFFIHDIGYIGKINMDGAEGEMHVVTGARIMERLFGSHWMDFCLRHSRFFSKANGLPPSRLCAADKLALAIIPRWLYLLLTNLTGEIKEYMYSENARTPAGKLSQWRWLTDVQASVGAWAYEHKDPMDGFPWKRR